MKHDKAKFTSAQTFLNGRLRVSSYHCFSSSSERNISISVPFCNTQYLLIDLKIQRFVLGLQTAQKLWYTAWPKWEGSGMRHRKSNQEATQGSRIRQVNV